MLIQETSEAETRQKPCTQENSLWNLIRILLTAGTVGGTILFFLRFMEWVYASGVYETLGAPSLVRVTLETAPGKYGMGFHWIDFLALFGIILVGAPIGFVGWIVLKAGRDIIKNKRQAGMGIRALFISGLLCLGWIAYRIKRVALNDIIAAAIMIVVAIVTTWILVVKDRKEIDNVDKVILITLIFVLILLIPVHTFHFGQQVAQRVLNGASSLPGVAIITNAPLAVSPAVDVDRGYNWRYYPREVPNTDGLVFSLQYVGEDENAVYILDYVARRVIVVPREEIHSRVLFPTATFRRGVPMIVNPRVSTPVQHATFSPLPLPSPSSSGR